MARRSTCHNTLEGPGRRWPHPAATTLCSIWMVSDDLNSPARTAADILRLLERAMAVLERRRRLRRVLALVSAAVLCTLVVVLVVLLGGV